MKCVYTFYSHISLPSILCIPSPCHLPFARNHLYYGHLLSVPKVFVSILTPEISIISGLTLVMMQCLTLTIIDFFLSFNSEYPWKSSTFGNATSDLASDYQLCLDDA